jgi:hypothetical protein
MNKLGVDIGGVLIGATDPSGRRDTAFLNGGEAQAMATPPVEGAFEAMRRLVARFEGRVWLVSKCGANVEGRTRRWLAHHDFFARTGLAPDHLRFCRERPQKRDHCADLGITHFVDDRPDVLEHLRGLVPHRFLFGVQRGPAPDDVTPVLDWAEAERRLLE